MLLSAGDIGKKQGAHAKSVIPKWSLGDFGDVSATLVELLRGGQAALDLARVERVRAALEEARTRPEWRTFKVRRA